MDYENMIKRCVTCKNEKSIKDFITFNSRETVNCVSCRMKKNEKIKNKRLKEDIIKDEKLKEKLKDDNNEKVYTLEDVKKLKIKQRCYHYKDMTTCEKCNDGLNRTLYRIINETSKEDKKNNMFNEDIHIDKPFLKKLIFNGFKCTNCDVILDPLDYKFIYFIHRKDESKGYSKNNVNIICKGCDTRLYF